MKSKNQSSNLHGVARGSENQNNQNNVRRFTFPNLKLFFKIFNLFGRERKKERVHISRGEAEGKEREP